MFYEMKKIYIHQRGLLFVILFLLLNSILLMGNDKPVNPSIDEYKSQYDTYLEKVKGRLSKQNEQYLLDESHRINEAKISLDKLYDSYYDGDMTQKAFLQKQNKLEEVLCNQEGFERIFEQYMYVRENPEKRYFLYTNGWAGLLSNDNLDFLNVLLILVLVTPVFCHEFECSMDLLSLTMKKGGRYQAINKIVLVFASITVLCLLSFCLRYSFFKIKYGLDNGSYPLQSLLYYSMAAKNVSLMGTFLYTSLIKLFGYLSFSVLVLCLSVCIKRYALTLFASSAVILLPFFGLGNSSAKYIFTGPLGLMLANGFFRGSLYKTDYLTGEEKLIFQEISVSTIRTLLCVVLCMLILLIISLLYLRSNVWHRGRKKKGTPKVTLWIMLCVVLCCLTGCSHQVETGYDIYNYHSYRSYQNTMYHFYVDESDLNNINLVFEDKENGKIRDLVRTPLQSLTQVARAVYGNGDYVYYVKYNLNKSKSHETVDRISVVEVDTQTFNERILYEKNIDLSKEFFMGTVSVNNNSFAFLQDVNAFFLDKNNIYFIGEGVHQVNRKSGKIQAIDIPVNGNIAYDGQRIYFIGDRYQLSYYDTQTGMFSDVSGIIATKFYLADNEVLYLNRLDQKKLYTLNLLDNSVKKVLDKTVLDFSCDNKYIYYQGEDLKKYQIYKEGVSR